MKVVTVAHTEAFGAPEGYEWQLNRSIEEPLEADELAEQAGRLCYKSYNRPNPKTAENSDYLANILAQQHFSVLEHASATFYVSGVSRNLLVELERHRHLSFSVVSQRYVDHSEANVVYPPAFEALDEFTRGELEKELDSVHIAALGAYNYIYDTLSGLGFKKKQAREAARAALLGSTETEFLVTGNHRVWREILQKRMTPHADAEIYRFARKVYAELKRIAPSTYQDIKDPDE